MSCLICHQPVNGGCFEFRYGPKGGNQKAHIGYVCKKCMPQWAVKFYVNQSQSGSTIHVGHCPHCNYGFGPQWLPLGQPRAGTGWDGPFDSIQDANLAGRGPTGTHNCCLNSSN